MFRSKILLNYGSLAGAVAFVAFLLVYFIGSNPLGAVSWLLFWIPIPFAYKGLIQYRENESEGVISFWRAFTKGLTIMFIYASLFAMILYLFAMFVDGGLVELHKLELAGQMAETKEQIISLLGETYYDANIEEIKSLNPAGIARMEFFNKFLFGILVALIVAIFVKKDKSIFLQEIE